MTQIKTANTSQTWTFFDGGWHDGNVAIMGPRTQGSWLASVVFDGARAFEGVTPDLDKHCARINNSARALGLKAAVVDARWVELVQEGRKKFAADAALYIRPMYWADTGIGGGVRFDPESTCWCLCLYEAPMPPFKGGSITLSPFRKPTAESAPVFAKASCLYPNNSMALAEAGDRGFDNCLMRDALGNIAELGNANVFMVKDGVAYTPAPNGTFLSGITRARVIALLRADGVDVVEKALTHADFLDADEIFSAGNFAKVSPFTCIEDRNLQIGPVTSRARKLYWEFAHA
jgi:branched-chain amino acid aminotransferase